MTKDLVVGRFEIWRCIEHGSSVRASLSQDIFIARKVGDAKGRQPVLFETEQITRTAHTEIVLSDLKAIRRLAEYVQPLSSFVRIRRRKDTDVTGIRSATDAPAKLM